MHAVHTDAETQRVAADLRTLYTRLLINWNRRDAGAFASLFADDGCCVGFDGSQMDGPGEIRTTLESVFGDHPTARYVGKVQSVQQLSANAVVLHAIAGMSPPGESELMPQRNAIQTLVAVRRNEEWRIVLWQNTPARFDGRPQLVEQMTRELQEIQSANGG